MKFFRSLSSKTTYHFLAISKEVVIATILVILPIFYPNTAQAGIFSFMSGVAGDKALAKSIDIQTTQNSQNMTVLKAVMNSNPTPHFEDRHPILASENALVAEIGPGGTASEVDNVVSTTISLYVVRSGDTLSEISGMFDVSVNTIIWANNLGPKPLLKEGQTLVILPITGIQYTVKRGDTLTSIAKKYKADEEELMQYNGLSSGSTLAVGTTIIIPDGEAAVTSQPVPNKSAASTIASSRYYKRPINGGHKSQGVHGHNGVDLAAPVGTEIYAAADGTVIAALSNGGWNGGYGNYVIISHPNGTQTLYSHNSTNFVSVGQQVSKGELIAKVGMTGKTTGPHVHFEIRGAVNPF